MLTQEKEKDEELALFLETMRRRDNKLGSDDNNGGFGISAVSKTMSFYQQLRTGAENRFVSENEKSDYDWLLTPPGTPQISLLEKGSQKSVMTQPKVAKAQPTILESRLVNIQEEPSLIKAPTLRSSKLVARPTKSLTTTTTACTQRSSTPTANPFPKSKPRSSTPTLKSSTMSVLSAAPPIRSSSVSKSAPRKPDPSPRISSTVKSRPGQNLNTSLPEKRATASRDRPSSVGRKSSILHTSNNDNVSPGMVGTKMVERVVNMRKLAPPKIDDHDSSRKLSSTIGRTLSKSSLDMAMRHMDIRRTISGSNMSIRRSGSLKSKTTNFSDTSQASSSSSSESSITKNRI